MHDRDQTLVDFEEDYPECFEGGGNWRYRYDFGDGELSDATIASARAAVEELRAERAAAAAAIPEYADEEEEAAAIAYEAFLQELEPPEPEPGGEDEGEFYEARDE